MFYVLCLTNNDISVQHFHLTNIKTIVIVVRLNTGMNYVEIHRKAFLY